MTETKDSKNYSTKSSIPQQKFNIAVLLDIHIPSSSGIKQNGYSRHVGF